MAVHIRGASAEFASRINGKFNPLQELDEKSKPILCDGKPIYLKDDGTDVCIEYNAVAGGWQVKPGHARGKCVAWASISSAGSIESCSTGIWLVWNSQSSVFPRSPTLSFLLPRQRFSSKARRRNLARPGKRRGQMTRSMCRCWMAYLMQLSSCMTVGPSIKDGAARHRKIFVKLIGSSFVPLRESGRSSAHLTGALG